MGLALPSNAILVKGSGSGVLLNQTSAAWKSELKLLLHEIIVIIMYVL